MVVPTHKHLTTFQREFDDTFRSLIIRAPIVSTLGLLKITLSLGFRLDPLDNLIMGLHKFGMS